MMEEGLFIKNKLVREALDKGFIELRVHTDTGDKAKLKANLELQSRLAETTGLPTFVVIDTSTEKTLRRKSGVMGEAEFLEFLVPTKK